MKAQFTTLTAFIDKAAAIAKAINANTTVTRLDNSTFVEFAPHVSLCVDEFDDDPDGPYWTTSWRTSGSGTSQVLGLPRLALLEIMQALGSIKTSVVAKDGVDWLLVTDHRGTRSLPLNTHGGDRVVNLNNADAIQFFCVPTPPDEMYVLWEAFFEHQIDHLAYAVEWRADTLKHTARRATVRLADGETFEVYYG